jgi:hypothetical protein
MKIYPRGTYAEPPTEPPDEKYITANCGHEVWEHESTFNFNGKDICPDCFRDEVMYFLDPAYPYRLTQLADAMGVDYENVGS